MWVCYVLMSVDSGRTYVGATNNLLRRLNNHNRISGGSHGARATRGEMWMPILFVSGFKDKIGCLSFESGVRRVVRRRGKKRYKLGWGISPIERRIISVFNLLYLGSPLKKWTRDGLQINWLEVEYRMDNLELPDGVSEKCGIGEVALS